MKEKLVEKLFNNACTREELEMLLQLIKQDPTPPDERLMKKLWEQAQGHPKLMEGIHDKVFSKILSKIDHEKPALSIPKRKRLFLNPKAILVAASFLVLIVAGIWMLQQNNSKTIIQTAFGERKTLALSDGSKVELNANSQMTYEDHWPEGIDRKIWLHGEAFFDVQKKPETGQRLQVITDDLIVEVLGTSFNVNSVGDQTSVYLEEGEIRLYLNALDSIILMKPGDLIVYSEQTQKITRKQSEQTELHTSWKHGVLTFENASLENVLQKIEAIYGIEFKVENDTIFEREVNIPLPIDELETAISILNKTISGIDIKKGDENQFIIQ